MSCNVKRTLSALLLMLCLLLSLPNALVTRAEASTNVALNQSDAEIKNVASVLNSTTSSRTLYVKFAVKGVIYTYSAVYNPSSKSFTVSNVAGSGSVTGFTMDKTDGGFTMFINQQWGGRRYTITPSSIDIVGIFDPSEFSTFSLYNICFGNSVTLNTNGGSIVERDNVRFYMLGKGATLPSTVSRKGYLFEGWYENANFTGSRVTAIPGNASGNKTYYAKWAEVTDTYDLTISVNVSIPTDANFTYTNAYIYCGKDAANKDIYTSFEGSSGSLTVPNADANTATFKVYFYGSYKYPGSSWGVACPYQYVQLSCLNEVTNASATGVCNNPAAAPDIPFTYTVTKKSNAIAVTYNYNDGETANAAVSVSSGKPTTLLTPTRFGYTFDGWYTAANGGTKVGNGGASYTPTGNVTLYAHWSQVTYTVTLNRNTGTGGTGSVQVAFGSAMPKVNSLPTKAGYTFAGYFDSATGGAQYYNDKGVSTANWNKLAGDTLYAHWTPIPATAPTITQQPQAASFDYLQGGQLTAAGSAASGHTIDGYQWYRNSKKSTDGAAAVTGATTATLTIPSSQDAGDYYYYCAVTSKRTDNGEKAPANTNIVKVTINKIASSIVVHPEDVADFSYDGTAHTLLSGNGTCLGGTIQYSLDGTNYSPNVPSATDAGDYTIYYKVVGDKNHNDTQPQTLSLHVAKIDAVLTNPPATVTDLEYTGKPQALVNAGTVDGGAIWYKLDDGEYATAIPTATLVDEYTVYYKVVGDKNHNDIPEASVTNAIAEVDKTAFRATIATATDYHSSIAEDYETPAAALSTALTTADGVDKDKNVTVKQVADADKALSAAVDTAKAAVAVAKIDAIAPEAYTADCKAKIDDARAAYDSLNDTQKALVPKASVNALVKAETDYNAVDDAVGKIGDIGAVAYTPESKSKIDDARKVYNALTADQKAILPEANYKVLTDAETDYNAVDNAVGKINAIGDVVYTPESKGKIDTARNVYDALTDSQKAIVPEDTYAVLTQAEIDYAAVDLAVTTANDIGTVTYDKETHARIDAARKAYDALTEAQLAITPQDVLPTLTAAEELYNAVDKVAKRISAIGSVSYTPACESDIDAARWAYNKLTPEQKAIVPTRILSTLTSAEYLYESVEKAVKEIEAIGTVTYTPACKSRIDAARAEYNGLSGEQKAIVPSGILSRLTGAEADYNAVSNTVEKIIDIGKVAYTVDSHSKIATARAACNAMSAAQKAILPDTMLQSLTDAETNYDAVDKVVSKADAIGTVAYTHESKARIDEAMAAYDTLTAEQKEMMPAAVLSTVTDADALYTAVDDAVQEILAIGQVAYTDESKAKIDSARELIDKLSDAQKAILPAETLTVLTAAEEDYNAVEEAVALASGTSKEDQAAALEAYENLTDAQRAMLAGHPAAAELEAAHSRAQAMGILWVAVAAICAVAIFFLIFLIVKRRKKDEEETAHSR